jgi:diguanylate cyclase (GGDEF)-like protein/PAS domain S-box-containing protein
MPKSPPLPQNESERLARLSELLILDSAPEPLFDSIARLASDVCGAPIALLSLVDAERQWFKANVGLAAVNETPRDVAFCAHAIGADGLFEIEDARSDTRFADNPLVRGDPDIRFYAGAPLALPGGVRVGTLCVIDRRPRRLDAAQAKMLRDLARIATEALLMRRDLIVRALSVRSGHEKALAEGEAKYRQLVHDQRELISLAQPDGTLVYVNPAYARPFGKTAEQLTGTSLFDLVEPDDHAVLRERFAKLLAGGEVPATSNRNRGAGGAERWIAWTNTLQHDTDGQPLIHSVGRDVTEQRRAEEALRASEALLESTGSVAGVGGWEVDLDAGSLRWTSQTRKIHEVAPDFVPTLDTAIGFYAPEARPLITQAVQTGIESGKPWDLELPLITAAGRSIWVRAVGEVVFERGRAVRLIGAFQDITERMALQQRLADNERFLREITDALPVRIAYLDSERRYRFVNRLHCERFGLPREAILGRTRNELLAGASSAAVDRHVSLVLEGQPQVFEFDEWVGGQQHTRESRLVPDVGPGGVVRGFFSTSFDISERTESQRLLQQQSATLHSITEAVPAVIAVWGNDLRCRFVNSAFERWRGLPREQIVGRMLADIVGEADFARIQPWAMQALAGDTVSFERDYPGRGSAAHLAITYIPLRPGGGRIDGFVSVAQDITAHRLEQVRLLQLVQRDPLTGLLNRAGFTQRLDDALGDVHGGAAAPSTALLYVDLDRFKPVNDRHGHAVGDRLLQLVADRLVRLVRPSDAVARLGGDEFAILLSGVREARHAVTVAQKVVAAIAAPFDAGDAKLHIGASVGVAVGTENATELMARADAALYKAKGAGRGVVRLAGG